VHSDSNLIWSPLKRGIAIVRFAEEQPAHRFDWLCFPKTNLSSTCTAKLALSFGRGLENGGFSFGVSETFYRKRSKRQ